MSSGRPVVSTQLGAEGAEVVDDQHLLLADNASEFAAAIVRLLNDRDKCSVITGNSRRLVEELYDWDALIARAMGAFGEVSVNIVLCETRGVASS